MKPIRRAALLPAALFLCLSLGAQVKLTRPKITGIAHIRVYVTNVEKSRAFYTGILGLPSGGGGCAGLSRPCFPVNAYQEIELEQVATPGPKNWLAEVAFSTDDVEQMHRYLRARGFSPDKISKDPNGARHFRMRDPEGNPIAFVQRSRAITEYEISPNQISTRLIHAGFVVRDLDAENRFYMGVLGFRLYWHGGFKDADTDWFEIQVPDGDNWIEYMLHIPRDADHRDLGVQNHFSLGVQDAAAAATKLRANGAVKFDGPEIGRDGKNSLDIYDPDFTRVEVMQFTPSQTPCCHPYTADHPRP